MHTLFATTFAAVYALKPPYYNTCADFKRGGGGGGESPLPPPCMNPWLATVVLYLISYQNHIFLFDTQRLQKKNSRTMNELNHHPAASPEVVHSTITRITNEYYERRRTIVELETSGGNSILQWP